MYLRVIAEYGVDLTQNWNESQNMRPTINFASNGKTLDFWILM